MKKLVLVLASLSIISCQNKVQTISETASIITTNSVEIPMEKQSIYQFKVKSINGDEFDFSTLKGKKILVVNTASKCGLTPQYKQLEELYKNYADKNLEIIGFPANNFGAQEPGSNQEIASFCQKNYGVSFKMMEKISVKGTDMHPVYQFLTQKSKNGLKDSSVEWNFQKYLIDENGYLQEVFAPNVEPTSDVIIEALKR